jgi:eukaryotic-like serine/threonine-protein kinase
MSSDDARARFARVQSLFLDALERPYPDRRPFLDQACEDDPTLVDDVLALLDAHEEGPLADTPTERPWGGRYPERVGDYRIVRPLGEGGMGAVLLAVREAEGFTQTVALKLLRAGFPHRDLEARLRAERKILARLEHPGIARLIDGGVTDQGQPFFAMEYVKGEDILTWCDARRLDVSGRIRLFMDVCDAVHHAHQQLVIHRDLKPSNILVTAAGRPKLLDFGVAKLLDEEAAEGGQAGLTRTSPWVTPAYASPEQLRGDPVSTLSDVYALGVLLHELLVGLRPYRTEGRSPADLERAMARTGTRKPSQAAVDRGGAAGSDTATGQPDPATRAQLRGTSPERLRRRLEGDLDVILGRAMAHDPGRRYGSAAALAEDLRRHLGGWPVQARPDGFAYRAGKFLGRHRVAMASSVAVVLTVVGGAGTALWQADRARDAARLAEDEAVRARQVTGLVTDLFRLSDPTRTLGDTVTARQLLDEGAARVETELSGQPRLQATLLAEVGRVYRNLGLLARAEELAEQVVQLEASLDSSGAGHARALGTLGEIVAERGRTAEAATHFEQALALPLFQRRNALGTDTLAARLTSALAWEYRSLGRHQEAADLFRRALETQRAALGERDPETARSLMGLASALHDDGRFDEAEALLTEALEPGGAAGRPDPVVASVLANLGMIRRLRQDYRAAEPLLQAALDHRQRLYGPDHPETLSSMDSWGAELYELGRFDEARAVLDDALERALTLLGPVHTSTMSLMEALATVEIERGTFGRALALRDSAIVLKRIARGGDHAGIVYSFVRLTHDAREAGRPDRALEALDSARAMGRRLSDTEGVYRGLMYHEEALLAESEGRHDVADLRFADAARVLSEALRTDHRYRLELERDRALFRLRRGASPDSVVRALARVDSLQRLTRPSPHPRLARTALALGEAWMVAGEAARAADAFRTAEAELAGLPTSHWLRGWARAGQGVAARTLGDVEGSERAEAGLALVARHLGPEAPEFRRLRRWVDGP